MASLADLTRSLKLRLVAMTDPARGGDPLAVARRLPAGSWLIFRHYELAERSVLAAKLAGICRARRVSLLIAGDFGLAVALRVGLHQPDYQSASPKVRLWHRSGCRHGPILTRAAHSRRAMAYAARIGADAALLSPVFATASHPATRPLGLLALRRLVRSGRVPVIALGGINRANVRALRGVRLAGVAAVGAVTPPETAALLCLPSTNAPSMPLYRETRSKTL